MEDQEGGGRVPNDVASMSIGLCDWCIIRPEYSKDGTAVQLQYGFGNKRHVPDFIREIHEKAKGIK